MSKIKVSLFGSMLGALLLFAAPAGAGAIPSGVTPDQMSAPGFSLTQPVAHQAPAGKKCLKWTRRWNTRHGFGHRRCVQWR